jgi:hypothetical protein
MPGHTEQVAAAEAYSDVSEAGSFNLADSHAEHVIARTSLSEYSGSTSF